MQETQLHVKDDDDTPPGHADLFRDFLDLCAQHEWTQEQMAYALRVNPSTISRHRKKVRDHEEASLRLNEDTAARLESTIKRLRNRPLLEEYQKGVRDALEAFEQVGDDLRSMLPPESPEEKARLGEKARRAARRKAGQEEEDEPGGGSG